MAEIETKLESVRTHVCFHYGENNESEVVLPLKDLELHRDGKTHEVRFLGCDYRVSRETYLSLLALLAPFSVLPS